jgi:ligand-binding sensor domain-containing protein
LKTFILFLFIFKIGLSQNGDLSQFYVQHYTVNNGLPSNCVYSATEDLNGNIWFASENGVSRFDGKKFRNYGIKEGLKNNEILSVKFRYPFVLAYSFKGVDFILNNKIVSNKLKIISKTFSGNIYLEEIQNKKYISARNDSIFLFDLSHIFSSKLIKSSNYNDDGISHRFYNILRKFQNKFYHAEYLHYYDNLLLYNLDIQDIKIYDTKKDSIYTILIPDKYREIRGVSSYENKFFVNEYNSLYEYEIVNYRLIFKKKVSFSSTVNSVFYKRGLYYVNTLTDGVYILREKGKNINIDQLQITGIEVDTNNQIVIGVKEDYSKFFNHNGQKINKNIDKSRNGKPLLINNHLAWINRYDISYKQKNFNIIDLIKTIRIYNEDTILVGTRSFAIMYELKTGKKVKNLLNKWTVDFCVTQNKDIYIASPSGLYRYDNKNQLKKIKFSKNENIKVNSVTEDLQGNIWINTAGLGIYIFSPSTKKVVNLQIKDGLLSDNNSKIIIDKKNRKWILSNFGVLVIDGKRFFKINESEGIQSNEIIDLKVNEDTAWIANNKGLDKYIYEYNKTQIWIPLNINEIKINNQLVDSLPQRLTPIQNKIQFDFIGIYLPAVNEIKYNYRLTYDYNVGKWQKTDQNQLVFENLKHGKYILEIEAYHANYPNIRSKIMKIPFIINPHFYQTFIFWFVIFLIVLLLSSFMIYRIIKQRKQRELEKAELLAKVNESNLKSLQGQMNPHFVFNSLSTLQNLVLNQQDQEVLEYISEFSKLMRTMLDNSRNDRISIIDEIDFLKNYIDLEQIRFKNFFEVQWEIKIPLDDLEEIYIPTMLIQPIIENAIKHGVSKLNSYKGIIEIIIDLPQHDFVEIRIKDNGSNSIVSNKKHTSTAIKVIHERLELYQRNNKKGKFELDIKPNGAEALLTIPV